MTATRRAKDLHAPQPRPMVVAGTPRPVAWAVIAALALPAPLPLHAQAPAAGTAAPAAGPRAGRPAPAEDTVTLNFFNSDMEAVVRAIGQFTGRTFVIDPRVKGTLTLISERPVTRQQAYQQLLSALRMQGHTIVESPEPGGVTRVLPEADAKLQGGRVVAPATAAPRGDQIVTQVFRLQFESATNMVPVLRPLIAPNNTISAYPANNTLVITDYADNLRRIQRIIEAIDSPAASDVEVVPLQYGLAADVAAIANKILDESARATGQAVDAGQRVTVMAEPRTNNLIVRASSPARLAFAKQLIARFDQPSVTPGNINVVYLRNAEATKLAPLLRAVISSDPSFVQQASSGTGLSAGVGQQTGAGGLSQGGLGQPAQPAPQAAPVSSGGGGSNSALAGMIQADAATNSLIISAPEPLYRNLRAIIEKLDVRRAQIVVESLIAEVSVDRASEIGVQWQALGALAEGAGGGTRVIGGTNFGGSGTNIIGAAQNLASLGTGLNVGIIRGTVRIAGTEITNLGLLARALENDANANILSQPNIQTLDNEEGKFLVGQNVPFVTGSFSSTGTTAGTVNPFQTFERKDVGLQLRVKPQVSEGGTVKMAIYLEVSSVAPGTTGSGIVTNKRSFESQVIVDDGNFVVLSGLIEDRSSSTQNKVPLLGDIPVLGSLFKYETRTRNKTNTMVFLRPYVLRDEKTQTALANDRYDFMRNQINAAQPSEGIVFRGLNIEPLPPSPAQTRAVPAPAAPAAPVAPAVSAPRSEAPAADLPQVAAVAMPPPVPAQQQQVQSPAVSAPPPAPAPAPAAPRAAAGQPPQQVARTSANGRTGLDGSAGSGLQLIQVANGIDPARGRDLQRQLRTAGFDAYWESVRTPRGEDVRVRVQVDRATQSVADVLAELRRRGFQPVLVAQ